MTRAYLWAHCDILDLLDAVDPLQEYAERVGLAAKYGQDGIQKIIGDAFAPYIERNRAWLGSC